MYAKDLQTGHHLNGYDYGARYYDPSLARWTTPDPKSETFQESLSVYQYCLNNPILNNDPNGEIVPFLAAAAIIIGKAALGAIIDGSVQYVTNRAVGMSHSEAINNMDYTSIGAAAIISSITIPGISTPVKTTITATAVMADATIDVSNKQTQTAFGIGGNKEKPISNVVLDASLSFASTKASSSLLKSSKNSIANDLKPSHFAPLNATEKKIVKKTEKIINSNYYQDIIQTTNELLIGDNGIIPTYFFYKSVTKQDGSQTSSDFITPPSIYPSKKDNTMVNNAIYSIKQ